MPFITRILFLMTLISGSGWGCATVPKEKSVTTMMREKPKSIHADARETMYGTDGTGYSDARRRIRTGTRR